MIAAYELEPYELTDDFWKRFKEMYSDKKITLTVEEAFDETAFLSRSKSNREHILSGIKAAKEGRVSRAWTIEELEALAE